ncbi:MAG TPA: hypothetical protein VM536_23340 [Chloroflexia bacterium]|nr:hypothetical protein [Chloroflexia bacterium]
MKDTDGSTTGRRAGAVKLSGWAVLSLSRGAGQRTAGGSTPIR